MEGLGDFLVPLLRRVLSTLPISLKVSLKVSLSLEGSSTDRMLGCSLNRTTCSLRGVMARSDRGRFLSASGLGLGLPCNENRLACVAGVLSVEGLGDGEGLWLASAERSLCVACIWFPAGGLEENS